MQQVVTYPPKQLPALGRLYSLPVSKLREGRARISDNFDAEVQAWADAVENNNAEETLEHWRAAIALSEQLKIVMLVIGIKTYTGD